MGKRLTNLGSRVPIQASRLVVVEPGSWRTGNLTSSQRGYGSKWAKARAAYLAEHPHCVMCLAMGHVTPATVVDHIEPHRGDQQLFWRRSNWQPLCATHHSRDKQRDEVREWVQRGRG